MTGRLSSRSSTFACRVAASLGLLVCAGGCGHPLYIARAAQASAKLARAEQLDAAEKAPYEYYYALEHLREARSEALQAEYGDAVALLQVAFDYATRAVEVSQRMEPAPVNLTASPAPSGPANSDESGSSPGGAP